MNPSDTPASWQSIWTRRGWRARLLWPVSRLYGLLFALRKRRYRQGALPVEKLPVPVIVVGNVVVGGAGKTPATLAILQHLLASQWRPGVVSRGHGRQGTRVLELGPDTSAADGGDEPVLIRRKTGVPVFVGRERAEAAGIAVCAPGRERVGLRRRLAAPGPGP